MTKAEFERGYAARGGMTVAQLRALGRVVRPCHCEAEECEGWQSVSHEHAREYDLGFRPSIWRRAWVRLKGIVLMPKFVPMSKQSDAELHAAILEATNDGETAQLIDSFYRDMDRAERTDRRVLYYHLGLLVGIVLRLTNSERLPQ